MSAPYVPGSPAELAGYLASIVEHAAADHPDDEGLARGVAAWQAWKAAQGWDTPPGIEDAS